MMHRFAVSAGLSLILSGSLPCAAEVYRYTDAQGHIHYTNQPPAGVNAESVNVTPTYTVLPTDPTPPTPEDRPSTRKSSSGSAITYSVFQIVGIEANAAIRANDGDLNVSIQLVPALQAGHQIHWLLDGQSVRVPSSVSSLSLSNLDRGEHQLQAEVLRDQQVIQRSAVVPFHIQRTHIAH